MLHIASASGNVFGYLWQGEAPADFDGPRWARSICPRGDGLGLDGLFLLETFSPGKPWKLTHWDPDGSRSFCSNGTRAAAALLPPDCQGALEAIVSGESVQLRREDNHVALRMPEGEGYGLAPTALDLGGDHGYGWTGTPHLIVPVPDTETIDLSAFGPPLRHHPELPHGANVSVITVTRPGEARIRTWERGVEGETLCCGQGCAVAGAWLASRTGQQRWTFLPRGRDSVQVTVGSLTEGRWTGLWLSGRVRRLGGLVPGDGLELSGA